MEIMNQEEFTTLMRQQDLRQLQRNLEFLQRDLNKIFAPPPETEITLTSEARGWKMMIRKKGKFADGHLAPSLRNATEYLLKAAQVDFSVSCKILEQDKEGKYILPHIFSHSERSHGEVTGGNESQA